MITFVTGVPGSGKSYFAVNKIYDALIPQFKEQSLKELLSKKPKEQLPLKYEFVYTNINEFRFDIFPNQTKVLEVLPPEELPKNKKLEDYLYPKLQQLHALYLSGVDDDELNDLAKELGIYKSMFVIDEAHNIFSSENKILIWWLSYHRHMYQEIILVTQNLSLVNSKYKAFTEFFYKAHASSMKLFKSTFTYSIFVNSRMSQNAKSGTEKIKFNQEVFNLYHSGDNQKSKNVILRFIMIALFFLVLVFIGGSWFLSSKDDVVKQSKEVKVKKSQSMIKSKPQKKKPNYEDAVYQDTEYIKITCLGSDCRYNGEVIPEEVLRQIVKITSSKILQSDTNQKLNIKTLYVLINEGFKNKFKRSLNNEKTNFNPLDMLK